MAAITPTTRYKPKVIGEERVHGFLITIAANGDTLDTGLAIVEHVDIMLTAAAAVGVSDITGGVLTFAATGGDVVRVRAYGR